MYSKLHVDVLCYTCGKLLLPRKNRTRKYDKRLPYGYNKNNFWNGIECLMIKHYFYFSVSYRLLRSLQSIPLSTFHTLESFLPTAGTFKQIWHLKEWQEIFQGQSAAIIFEEMLVTEIGFSETELCQYKLKKTTRVWIVIRINTKRYRMENTRKVQP